MRILTNHNTVYNVDNISFVIGDFAVQITPSDPSKMPIEEFDLRYCVLDYSNQNDVDFHFPPVVFLDQYTRSAADLRIGNHRVQVPLDWSVVIADKNTGSLELLDLKHINDREFQVFCFNPINGYMPSFPDIEIENIFPDVSWTTPKLLNGHLLAVPIQDCDSPLCALFVKDTNKLPDTLDITKIFS